MRKSLIITIAAALLLAAVLCTAGCVENKVTDPAVGDWSAYDEDTFTVFSVYEDGSGVYLIAKAAVSETGEAGYVANEESTFVWAKNADGTYVVSFADGDKFTVVVDANRGVLTMDDGSVFEKQPSVLSGTSYNEKGLELAEEYYSQWLRDHPDATDEEKLAKWYELAAQYQT